MVVSVTQLPENRGHRPEDGVFWTENDVFGLRSSSPIKKELVDLFRFWSIFGHFWSKATSCQLEISELAVPRRPTRS